MPREKKTARRYDIEEATYIGLNEALFLGQLRYWIERSDNYQQGRKWVFNSYTKWQEQFPFWGERTLRRTIKRLEKEGFIETGNFNNKAYDITKWYSINEAAIKEYIKNQKETGQNNQTPMVKMTKGGGQNGTMDMVKMTKPIPTITTKTTTKNNYNTVPPKGYTVEILETQLFRISDKGNFEDPETFENAIDVIAYYVSSYQRNRETAHPLLTDKKMEEVINKLIEGCDKFPELIFDTENYHAMVDTHFSKNYGIDVDFNISHFATEGILEKLAYQNI